MRLRALHLEHSYTELYASLPLADFSIVFPAIIMTVTLSLVDFVNLPSECLKLRVIVTNPQTSVLDTICSQEYCALHLTYKRLFSISRYNLKRKPTICFVTTGRGGQQSIISKPNKSMYF